MSPAPRSLPIETLLADAGWVRRLAARLVADPGAADDLAQQTLVAAWTRPPDAGTPARPWLARVLRNFARQRARNESSRALRERNSARGVAAPDDLLERAELAHELARHVLALEEPYRRTVLRRIFDGWSSEQIARAENTSASTVRTRLERALATLRQRLERERGQDWLAALLPLVKIGGGIAMGTGAKIGIGLCAAGLCGWLLWPRAQPLAPALEPPAQTAASVPAPLEHSSDVARTPQASEPAIAAKSGPPAPVPHVVAPGTIEGLVVRLHGESELPLEGAQVELRAGDDLEREVSAPEPPLLASTRSAADGKFHFKGLAPGGYTLRAESGRGPWHGTRARVPEEGPGPSLKIVFGSTRIHGRVFDEQGEVLAGVPLRIDGGHELKFDLHAYATSDERGNYAFEELPAGKYFGLVTRDWQTAWPGRMWYLALVDGDDLELDLGQRTPLPHWRGTVRTGTGEPVNGGGKLHLERVQLSKLGSEAKTYREVLFDASARFDVRLEPASWHPGVSLQSNPNVRRTFDNVAIGSDDLEHDLVLPGARLRGTVFDSVTLQPLTGYAGVLQVSVSKPGKKTPSSFQTVLVDEAGRFAIDMLEVGPWELTTFPLKVAAAGQKLELVIARGEVEQRLDVQVQKP